MIEQICKRAFKAHPHVFRETESLDNPAAIVAVPGPSRIPTPQFPTGPSGIGLNAAMLNTLPVAAFATLPLPMQSGRCKLPRKERLRLPGSKLELVVGVRYGPASQRLTALTDHPPSARSEIRFMCERNLRFCPTGTSYTAESKKRLRRAPAILPRFAERSKRLATEGPSSGAQTAKGKYKEVVSNFIKQRMGRISFLNPPQHWCLPSCRRKPLFFRWITSRSLRNLYESLRTF